VHDVDRLVREQVLERGVATLEPQLLRRPGGGLRRRRAEPDQPGTGQPRRSRVHLRHEAAADDADPQPGPGQRGRHSVASVGSQDTSSGGGTTTVLATSTGRRASPASMTDCMTSSTWNARSPDARSGTPARIARTSSTTPLPRPAAEPSLGRVSTSSRPRVITRSPANVFGSGTVSVASSPVTSNWVRASLESKEKMLCAVAPLSNSSSVATCVGTLTGKV